MTAKKDDTCGADAGIKDDLTPMRQFGSAGPAAYTTGPSHVDRADFRDTEASSEPSDTAEDAPPLAPDDDPDTKPGV